MEVDGSPWSHEQKGAVMSTKSTIIRTIFHCQGIFLRSIGIKGILKVMNKDSNKLYLKYLLERYYSENNQRVGDVHVGIISNKRM